MTMFDCYNQLDNYLLLNVIHLSHIHIFDLDEKLNADALEKYGDSGSGKSLPFASLSDKIQKKKKPE